MTETGESPDSVALRLGSTDVIQGEVFESLCQAKMLARKPFSAYHPACPSTGPM